MGERSFYLFRAGTYPSISVTVKTKDGRNLKEDVLFPKGHPKNRMTVDEFKDRFRTATSPVLEKIDIEKAIDKILNLEKVKDINDMTDLLHK